MRNQFIRSLIDRQESHQDVFLLVADLGYSLIEPFAELYPDRYLNLGIAEQNMISISAGIASQGFKVFNYSIANFNTFRAAEQLRNDVDYHGLDVTTVSVGGGCAYGHLGYSHHALQDYALMRSLPNMNIYAPADPRSCNICLNSIFDARCPNYLRLHKSNEPCLPALAGTNNYLTIYSNNSECLHLATGFAANYLVTHKKVPYTDDFILMYLWGNQHRQACYQLISQYSVVHVYEDHLLSGGFASWVLEVAAQNECYNIRIKPHAFSDHLVGQSVTEDYAFTHYLEIN